MRGNRIVVRSGLSLAALLVLAACSSGVKTNNSASTSSSPATTTSAAPTTVAAAGDFCKEASHTFDDLSPAFDSSSNDPAALASAFQQAEAKVRSVQSPPELAADWGKLADALHTFSGMTANLHPGDPAAASSFAVANAQLIASLGLSAAHIEEYLVKNCGLLPSGLPSGMPTGSAAPTS
jgi:hypothetical protein